MPSKSSASKPSAKHDQPHASAKSSNSPKSRQPSVKRSSAVRSSTKSTSSSLASSHYFPPLVGMPYQQPSPALLMAGPQYSSDRAFNFGIQQHMMTLPAGFDLTMPINEAAPLQLPKFRGKVKKAITISDIDWDSAAMSWWKENRAAKVLRYIFYVSWFLGFLKAQLAASGKEHEALPTQSETFLFEVTIKEIMSAIHRIYLDKHSEIYKLLQTLMKTRDLSLAMGTAKTKQARRYDEITRDATEYGGTDDTGNAIEQPLSVPLALQETVFLLENFVYQITFIMPRTGLLGCHSKSAMLALIKDGQLFPFNELWTIEKKIVRFDYTGRTTKIDDRIASMLIGMVFLARGFVWTLLLNPIEYGIIRKEDLTGIGRSNLRLMATLLLFVYRRFMVSRRSRYVPPPPREIAHHLIPDEQAVGLMEQIENSLVYCDGLMREWAAAYVRRLRQAKPASHVSTY